MIEGVVIITQLNVCTSKLFSKLKVLNFEPTGVRQHYLGETLDGFAIRFSRVMTESRTTLHMIHESCEGCKITLLTSQGYAYTYIKDGFFSPLGNYSKLKEPVEWTGKEHTIYIPRTKSTYLIK